MNPVFRSMSAAAERTIQDLLKVPGAPKRLGQLLDSAAGIRKDLVQMKREAIASGAIEIDGVYTNAGLDRLLDDLNT